MKFRKTLPAVASCALKKRRSLTVSSSRRLVTSGSAPSTPCSAPRMRNATPAPADWTRRRGEPRPARISSNSPGSSPANIGGGVRTTAASGRSTLPVPGRRTGRAATCCTTTPAGAAAAAAGAAPPAAAAAGAAAGSLSTLLEARRRVVGDALPGCSVRARARSTSGPGISDPARSSRPGTPPRTPRGRPTHLGALLRHDVEDVVRDGGCIRPVRRLPLHRALIDRGVGALARRRRS